MESTERKPKVRRERNFIVEENIDTIQWPQECSVCGGAIEQTDNLKLKRKFKTFGEINVEIAGIPYCQGCFTKSRATKRLDNVVWVISLVLGIPLGLIVVVMMMRDPSVRFICLPVVFVLTIGVCYGLVWLVVRLPVKAALRGRFAEPIDAWLIEEKKSDGKEGLSVVIAIPDKDYADRFAQLNGIIT